MSLSVMLTQEAYEQEAVLVGFGGGNGMLSSFSWGADQSIVKKVQKLFEQYGFSVSGRIDPNDSKIRV